ncbi:MAG: RIP metalloprotease RseP [Alphaproteobacteria bacterium]|nr:RIP metalloprotease RseP [Alphaproteobacteria bacterium]
MTLVQFAAGLGWWLIVVIPAFLIVLTLIVFVHELGHFLMGRAFGVRIDSFSIGFGRAIAGFHDRHGTHWKIGWLPLGGYVKFWGDAGVSSNPDHDVVDQATPEERAQSFHHKALYQKSLIAVAGPLANFVLAIAIFAATSMIGGELVTTPQIGRIVHGTPAEAAGFKPGDTVLSIDGAAVHEFSDIVKAVLLSDDEPLTFVVARDGRDVTIKVTPKQMDRKDDFGNPMRESMIGVGPVLPSEVGDVVAHSPAALAGIRPGDVFYKAGDKPVQNFDELATALRASAGKSMTVVFAREGAKSPISAIFTPEVVSGGASSDAMVTAATGLVPKYPGSPKTESIVRFGPIDAVSRAVNRVWFFVAKTFDVLGRLLTGTGDVRQLSGPIGIAQVSGQIIDQLGPGALIWLVAVLSVSIGLLNLFPIPMLDGGHLLYYGIEAVRGRPLGEKAQELGFQIGLVLVVGLMLIATWNDLLKFRLF